MRHDESAVQIDWAQFTPWASLGGGILIGLAAIAFALLLGRVAGISGIIAGLLRPQKGDLGWRVAFVAGLLAAAFIYSRVTTLPALQIDAGVPLLVAAGLLVGIGTRYGRQGSPVPEHRERVRPFESSVSNRMVFIGQASLRRAVAEYMDRYHGERNHQGLENRLIHTPTVVAANDGAIYRHARLGGTLSFYYRKAA